jgi:aryl-alcohol dehydrogenase-like predicted oxidoreductase
MKWVRPDRSLAQTALRFVLALDGVSVALPSAVSIAQLDEDVGAVETPMLTAEELAEMRQLDALVQPAASSAVGSAEAVSEIAQAVSDGAALGRVAS